MSVRDGMALLDAEYPEWHKAIDVDRLDLGSTEDCILGQLYGGYSAGLGELDLHERSAAEMGFTYEGLRPDEYPTWGAAWADLTRQWREAIRERAA